MMGTLTRYPRSHVLTPPHTISCRCQVEYSNVIVLNKCDQASAEVIDSVRTCVEALAPRGTHVLQAVQSNVPPER